MVDCSARRALSGGTATSDPVHCVIILSAAIACFVGWFATATPAQAFQLIAAEEAALPPGTVPTFKARGSPSRLPSIIVLSPSGAGAVYSPLSLRLRFSAFGGAAIDPDSVVITYIKQTNIDITPRVKSFITADGIDIVQAEVPPGMHQFWVELVDTDGRSNGREFDFQVIK